ncbi:hypothetical protein EJ110_NYTH28717 [Nymphaea thermarum]|nr:hypothetical protein EJ110_NYTH28717 [Nymphaea thermarum]
MFNTEHQAFGAPLSPRISFSNDFVEAEHLGGGGCITKRAVGASASPEDADFEFSVSNNTMLTADQLFFQGRMLPFKDEGSKISPSSAPGKKMSTLKDELCVVDEERSLRPPKGSRRWKRILGLKRASATVRPKKNQPDIDVREERKIWGWREDGDQSSYRWYIQEKKGIEEEEGREEEGEPQQEENREV